VGKPRQWEETVDVLGRHFALWIEGPLASGRYEIRIWSGKRGSMGQQYLRAPIRGRDLDEARERALEVLHNYVGLDRYRLLVEEIATQVAPGAAVRVTEDAREVEIQLEGRYVLQVPLVFPRDQLLDPDLDEARLRTLVQAHLQTHTRAR
jgi:hypothetical protein